MSVHAKTPPTDDQCVLTITGPQASAAAALLALRRLGFVDAASHLGEVEHIRLRSHVQGLLDAMEDWGRLTGVEGADADDEAAAPVPWREAFPSLSEAERPGRMLRAARTKEDLSQAQLATLTGIPQRHISEMEHGKRAIGKERARKLAAALKVHYHVFL
jgi:DNA-binding XRE family transcriptional regulator